MEYEVEELLPIVKELTEKYTSKESSSVPYETARMLMEAVLYCINEFWEEHDNKGEIAALDGSGLPDARLAYEKGRELVVGKVIKAMEVYQEIMEDFQDYGCMNYGDTMRGMSQFFLRYDVNFCPQDHLLTLDYPCRGRDTDKCGADLIIEYLECILREKKELEMYDTEEVREILEIIRPAYEELFLDNICEAVKKFKGEDM